VKVARRDLFRSTGRITPVDGPAALETFMRSRLVRLIEDRPGG
jgi:hypothetical protein